MSTELPSSELTTASPDSPVAKPQTRISERLGKASELSQRGDLNEAAAELEAALVEARTTPYEIEFQTRIQLSMSLTDVYHSLNEVPKARQMLREESAFAEKISQIMQATGTPVQKRMATSGYLQVRDRATQMELLGEAAPEISVRDWIKGGPLTLAGLRGSVVLLEFWATWCKPCQEMFPTLRALYEKRAGSGLEIIALTRYYMAYRGTPESMLEELGLIRSTVTEHGVEFPVGVAEDERVQGIYGANGLPTAILIDRLGVVRYAGRGGDDQLFKKSLELL